MKILTSNDVSILSSTCEVVYLNRTSGIIELRDEMSLPKWVIIFFVLLFAALSMAAIHLYIQKLDNETEYVIKYTKNQSQTINNVLPNKST